MPKVKLSAAFAATAQCESGKRKTDYYDDGASCTGLVLECRSGGGRTWYLRFQNTLGDQKAVKLARYEDVNFDQVRRKARQLRSEITLGGDPMKDKADARAVPTYNTLAVMHMAEAEISQRSYKTTEGYVRNHLVPRWGKMRVDQIEPQAVARWLADKRAAGLSDGSVLKLRAIFGRSFEVGRRNGVAGCDRNPVRAVAAKPANNLRDRSLNASEVERLRAAAANSKNGLLPHIVDLLLFLGCRLNELLQSRWEAVDTERRLLFIPTSKNGRSRYVPLSAAALQVIGKLPRYEGCPWLIPNPETLKPFVTIKHGWQVARDAAGLPGLRLHDLRHAAASAMVSAGVDLYAVGKILGHANAASTQRYAHVANETLLAAVEKGAARLQQASPTN